MYEIIKEQDTKNIYEMIEQKVLENQQKYKYFMQSAKMKPIKNSSFEKVEYYSHIDGRVQGYFAYLYDKINNKIINIELISFEENPVFVRDFLKFCEYLGDNFRNVELSVIPGNPAYKLTRKAFVKYNFKRIGVLEDSIRLIDGEYYPVEIWQKEGINNRQCS